MKAYFAYILFFVFAIKPIYNVGYVVYYELNIDYIIETYCINKEKPQFKCNGKCHLAKQLTETPSSNSNDMEKQLPVSVRTFIPVFFQEYSNSFKPFFNYILVENNWQYHNQFTSLFQGTIDRPPQI